MIKKQVGRARKCGEIIVKTKCTLREAAKIIGAGKTTIHKDITKRLPLIDAELARQAAEVLDFNLHDRHLRGGKSTKLKYLNKSK